MLVTATVQTFIRLWVKTEARKSFWTSWPCCCVQCSHVHMNFLYLNWLEWNTVETVAAVAAKAVVPCNLYCNTLISILSPWVWTTNISRWVVLICCNLLSHSTGVLTANRLHSLVVHICCNLSLSLGFSAASLSHICCSLIPPSLGVSFALFLHTHMYFFAVRWLVFHCQSEQRTWHGPSPSAFSIFHSFVPLSLQHIRLCLVPPPCSLCTVDVHALATPPKCLSLPSSPVRKLCAHGK